MRSSKGKTTRCDIFVDRLNWSMYLNRFKCRARINGNFLTLILHHTQKILYTLSCHQKPRQATGTLITTTRYKPLLGLLLAAANLTEVLLLCTQCLRVGEAAQAVSDRRVGLNINGKIEEIFVFTAHLSQHITPTRIYTMLRYELNTQYHAVTYKQTTTVLSTYRLTVETPRLIGECALEYIVYPRLLSPFRTRAAHCTRCIIAFVFA
jgi:hypothetical protein